MPDSREEWSTDGTVAVEVPVHNPHDRPTTEVVQLYLHDPVSETVRPVMQLIAAARVELAAGENRTARFTLHADLTSYTGLDGRRIVDQGEVELRVSASSADVRQVLRLRLAGIRREVGAHRVLLPDVEVR